jgi:hypothetical protein
MLASSGREADRFENPHEERLHIPEGFAEANLALRFLSYNIRHYTEMKKQISKLIRCRSGASGWHLGE